MTSNWLLAIIPMFILLLISLFVRFHCKTWLQPAVYFPLFVMIYFFLPLLFVPDSFEWSGAMWWLLVSSLAFLSGALILTFKKGREWGVIISQLYSENDQYPDQEIEEMPEVYSFPFIVPVLITTIILGSLSSIVLMVAYGKSISALISLEGISGVGSEFSTLRYAGLYSPPLIVLVLLPFSYTCSVLGGILMAVRKTRKQLLMSLLSFLPSTLAFLIQTTKATILLSFILFISGYFACIVYIRKSEGYRIFTRKRLVLLPIIILTALLVFSFGDIARRGTTPTASGMMDALRSPRATSYIFGHAPAFSMWFQGAWGEREEPTFGQATFTGFTTIIGLGNKEIDNPPIYVSANLRTNIYGVFRRFIEDFTFTGSLIFLFVFGITASFVYSKVAEGALLLLPVLAGIYAFIGMQITPIFRFTSTVIAFLLLQVYFFSIYFLRRVTNANEM